MENETCFHRGAWEFLLFLYLNVHLAAREQGRYSTKRNKRFLIDTYFIGNHSPLMFVYPAPEIILMT